MAQTNRLNTGYIAFGLIVSIAVVHATAGEGYAISDQVSFNAFEQPIFEPSEQKQLESTLNIPEGTPRNATAPLRSIWRHNPDPADYDNPRSNMLENMSFQVGASIPSPNPMVEPFKVSSGYPDWRYCLAQCKLQSWCRFWVYKFDPQTYMEDLGSCDLSTGSQHLGHAQGPLQTIGGSNLIKGGPGVDSIKDSSPEVQSLDLNQYDVGFSYVLEGLLEPQVIARVAAVSANDCEHQCAIDYAENCVAWQFSNHPVQEEGNCLVLRTFEGKYQTDIFVTSGLRSAALGAFFHQYDEPKNAVPTDSRDSCTLDGYGFIGTALRTVGGGQPQGVGVAVPYTPIVASFTACKELCESREQCFGFEWSASYGGCFLYSSVTAIIEESSVSLGLVPCDSSQVGSIESMKKNAPTRRTLQSGEDVLPETISAAYRVMSLEEEQFIAFCPSAKVNVLVEDVDPTVERYTEKVEATKDCLNLCRSRFGCTYWTFDADLHSCSLVLNGFSLVLSEALSLGVSTSGSPNCYHAASSHHSSGVDSQIFDSVPLPAKSNGGVASIDAAIAKTEQQPESEQRTEVPQNAVGQSTMQAVEQPSQAERPTINSLENAVKPPKSDKQSAKQQAKQPAIQPAKQATLLTSRSPDHSEIKLQEKPAPPKLHRASKPQRNRVVSDAVWAQADTAHSEWGRVAVLGSSPRRQLLASLGCQKEEGKIPQDDNPLVYHMVDTFESCIELCMQLPEDECGFGLFETNVWDPNMLSYNTTCYLLIKEPIPDLSENRTTVSACRLHLGNHLEELKGQECPDDGEMVMGVVELGKYITSYNEIDLASCKANCGINNSCEKYNYDHVLERCSLVSETDLTSKAYGFGYSSGSSSMCGSQDTNSTMGDENEIQFAVHVPKDGIDTNWTKPDDVDNAPDMMIDMSVDLQVGMNSAFAEDAGFFWGASEGFKDWEHCWEECKETTFCRYWVFTYDETNEMGKRGCYFKSGPLGRGSPAPHIKTIVGEGNNGDVARRRLQFNMVSEGFIPEQVRQLHVNDSCLDYGFSYVVEGIAEPQILNTLDGLAGVEDCVQLCRSYPGCVAFQWTPIYPYTPTVNSTSECLFLANYEGKGMVHPFVISGTADCADHRPLLVVGETEIGDSSNPKDDGCVISRMAVSNGTLIPHDYSTPIYSQVPDFDTCLKLCDKFGPCKAAEYSSVHGRCALYAALATEPFEADNSSVIWLREGPCPTSPSANPRPIPGDRQWSETQEQADFKASCPQAVVNEEYLGHEIENEELVEHHRVKTIESCYLLCRTTYGCQYWTHYRSTMTCRLHSVPRGLIRLMEYNEATSGPSRCSPGGHTLVFDVAALQPLPAEHGCASDELTYHSFGVTVSPTKEPVDAIKTWNECQKRVAEGKTFVFEYSGHNYIAPAYGICKEYNVSDNLTKGEKKGPRTIIGPGTKCVGPSKSAPLKALQEYHAILAEIDRNDV